MNSTSCRTFLTHPGAKVARAGCAPPPSGATRQASPADGLLDWFVGTSSDEEGPKSEGTTDVLLMTAAETGYVAGIPARSKGAESHPHLVDMAEKFLTLMKHQEVKLRSDGYPAKKLLVQKIKWRWSQNIPRWWKKHHCTAQPATDVPNAQSKPCEDWLIRSK